MAYKRTIASDGVEDEFDVTFPYLRREHVKVEDGDGAPLVFGWINDSRILLQDPPPAGQTFTIIRRTPTTPLHVIHNNQPTPAETYNELTTQALYVAEEVSGGTVGGGGSGGGEASGPTSWGDIVGKPSVFPPTAHNHSIGDVSGLQSALNGKAPTGHQHDWGGVAGKPTVFPPSPHRHNASEIDGLSSGGTEGLFGSVAELLASTKSLDVGSFVMTLKEGFNYEVVASGGHLTTARGVRLRVLPTANGHNVKAFGAVMRYDLDEAHILQACINAAKDDNTNVYVPGGRLGLNSMVTLDISTQASESDPRPSIIGSGSGTTTLVGMGPNAGLRVIGDNKNGAAGHMHLGISGFRFTGQGVGLTIERAAFMEFRDLFFQGKADGVIMRDVLSIRFYNCRWRWGKRGVTMHGQTSFSRPNAITFNGCHWGSMGEYALDNYQGSALVLQGGSIEHCGIDPAGTGIRCGLRIREGGRQGEMVLSVDGAYIEGNGGTASIWIVHTVERGVYNISNCTINRIKSSGEAQHCILLDATGSTQQGQLNVRGCSFSDHNGHVTSASNRYVHATDPNGNITFSHSGNTYENVNGWPNINGGETVAMAVFSGSQSSPNIFANNNIESVGRAGAGTYEITFRRPIPTSARGVFIGMNVAGTARLQSQDANSVVVITTDTNGVNKDGGLISVAVIR